MRTRTAPGLLAAIGWTVVALWAVGSAGGCGLAGGSGAYSATPGGAQSSTPGVPPPSTSGVPPSSTPGSPPPSTSGVPPSSTPARAPSATPAGPPSPAPSPTPGSTDAELARLFAEQATGVEVTGSGIVTRLLDDDNEGARHQRFILRLASGQTLLIAHNIDIAPRLTGIATGDRVGFKGEYAYSDLGGTIHWTHHDPGGTHTAGWLEWRGHRYS